MGRVRVSPPQRPPTTEEVWLTLTEGGKAVFGTVGPAKVILGLAATATDGKGKVGLGWAEGIFLFLFFFFKNKKTFLICNRKERMKVVWCGVDC